MKATNCKKCKAKKTVEWFEDEKVYICWACGWVDKERFKRENDS